MGTRSAMVSASSQEKQPSCLLSQVMTLRRKGRRFACRGVRGSCPASSGQSSLTMPM